MPSDTETTPQEPAGTEAPYVLEDQVGFLLRLATQRHTAIFAERMAHGLTPTQFACLAKLADVGPRSQNELGRLIALDAATIKGVVDRLEVAGHVATARDGGDRRRRSVGLTRRGRQAACEAVACGRDITEATLAPLAPRERERLTELLRRIT